MYVYSTISIYIYIHTYIYIYITIWMCICIYTYIDRYTYYITIYIYTYILYGSVHKWLVCKYVSLCVDMYIYIYIYTYIHRYPWCCSWRDLIEIIGMLMEFTVTINNGIPPCIRLCLKMVCWPPNYGYITMGKWWLTSPFWYGDGLKLVTSFTSWEATSTTPIVLFTCGFWPVARWVSVPFFLGSILLACQWTCSWQ